MVRWLACQLEEFDVRVVCYLRPLGTYVKSFYKEMLKIGNDNRTLARKLDEQVAKRSIHVAPTTYLDFFAGEFGLDNLILRQYDRNVLVNGNTIDDFLDLIGLPPQAGNLGDREHNTSLPDELVDIKLTFNALAGSPRAEAGRVGNALAHASTTALGSPVDGGQDVLDALQREHNALKKHYGLDLGQAGNPYVGAHEPSIEARGTQVLITMLWKEVRDLRARVDELAPEPGPDRKRPKRYRHFARRLLNRVGNSKE